MKILITGAKGFIGRNLAAHLRAVGQADLLEYDVDTPHERLAEYAAGCDFVYHLAGINRPVDPADFMRGNADFTAELLSLLRRRERACPILVSSSIQAAADNPYGASKAAGEKLMFEYGREMSAEVYIYRLSNVFGKFSLPNYNSAVATFCYNIARGLPVTVNDERTTLTLVYIDDVLEEFAAALRGSPHKSGTYCAVPVTHTITLGEIVALLRSFESNRRTFQVPDLSGAFTKKLYSTYLSYLPEDGFAYPLAMHSDARGSFTEFLRTEDRGQVSVNISAPGVTKGNHWHHTKTEKFLVVSGRGVVRFRRIDGTEVLEYAVDGETLRAVDIPPGYTHNITNTGGANMVTLMWASERFDPDRPDTFPMDVKLT